MRILYVADGRSPIALQWMQYFADAGHEIHLVSTFDCQPNLKLASLQYVPVAYSGAASSPGPRRGLRALLPASLRTSLRNLTGPLTLRAAARSVSAIISEIKPDFVHAMRIPYEGMLAAAADPAAPLLISSWGNDFTLHARSTPLMAAATKRAMRRADALHSDTHRDLRLAHDFGFGPTKPNLVMPGNGGVRRDIFFPAKAQKGPRIVNPRGLRAYVRNDTFFDAIAMLVKEFSSLQVDCPAMQGEAQAESWVRQHKLTDPINLLPKLSPEALADVYRKATVLASPSIHDGTPNTLLEGMASGLLPVAGDLESIREWIKDGENGLLANAADPASLAAALRRALTDSALRERAAAHNAALIAERADYAVNMLIAEKFYESLI